MVNNKNKDKNKKNNSSNSLVFGWWPQTKIWEEVKWPSTSLPSYKIGKRSSEAQISFSFKVTPNVLKLRLIQVCGKN